MTVLLLVLLAVIVSVQGYEQPSEIKNFPGFTSPQSFKHPLPHTYVSSFPKDFTWGDIDGVSYLTKNLNQHLPQYCGSCWAHAALSSLADRIKIARNAKGVEINLSIQYILNCAGGFAGSCHGGHHTAVYQFIKEKGFVPFDTCLQYAACSAESSEGLCAHGEYSCSAINTCRTCGTFSDRGGSCVAINTFPNATVAEYGEVKGEDKIMAEIFARGPVSCEVNAGPLHAFHGGIFDDPAASHTHTHVVSIVGWGESDEGKPYWIVRNSWGEYWGEMGFFRVKRGENQLGLENGCAWATPGEWTEHNTPCDEDGLNCQPKTSYYIDPSTAYVKEL